MEIQRQKIVLFNDLFDDSFDDPSNDPSNDPSGDHHYGTPDRGLFYEQYQ
jgi:hypothetical protein